MKEIVISKAPFQCVHPLSTLYTEGSNIACRCKETPKLSIPHAQTERSLIRYLGYLYFPHIAVCPDQSIASPGSSGLAVHRVYR